MGVLSIQQIWCKFKRGGSYMKPMKQPKNCYTTAFYAENLICRWHLSTCTWAVHAKHFIIFVVANQVWFTIQRAGCKSESVLIHSQKTAFIPRANQCLIHYNISPRRAPCGADAPHRTRTRWSPQTHRLARLWGCGAAWAVQLTTGEYNLLHTKRR